MKKAILLSLYLTAALIVSAQSNKSNKIYVNIQKESIPAVLNVVKGTLQFVDQDNNNVIDANESCKIRFQISNTGRGDGYGCVAHTTISGTTQGISVSDVPISRIASGGKQWVEIPITANALTQTGEVALSIVVNEPHGFGTDKIQYKIGTHKLKTPNVQVVSFKTGSATGILERRKSFTLQIIVQNVDQGTAEDVQVNIKLPKTIMGLSGDYIGVSIPQMRAGESRTLEYELIANKDAAEQTNIQIALSEKQGKYAENASIPIQFGQHVGGGDIAMDVERKDQDVEIITESLTSEVDENIPIAKKANTHTFVVIVANENYQSVATVPFALNDGNIFREYCMKTLGISEKQINYIPNATGNQMKSQVKWLQDICEVYKDENPNVIFYYAGHGIPDEQSRTAYLLPVDGIGNDCTTGYNLDHLYAALGNIPAKNVTVFVDACFSGSKREQGMLTSARGVAIKVRSGWPRGNMVVFSAAQGDETAYPNYEEKHGMFTYFLLKKLQDTQGKVTLQELADYITRKVSQQSMLINKKQQTPCVTASSKLGDSWKTWTLMK
jgi:hypothetical protein